MNPTDERWYFTMNLTESNGVGITVLTLTFVTYDQEDHYVYTQMYDSEEIQALWEYDYVSGNSTISWEIEHYYYENKPHYINLMVTGTDDHGHTMEETIRVDFYVE